MANASNPTTPPPAIAVSSNGDIQSSSVPSPLPPTVVGAGVTPPVCLGGVGEEGGSSVGVGENPAGVGVGSCPGGVPWAEGDGAGGTAVGSMKSMPSTVSCACAKMTEPSELVCEAVTV